MSALTDVMVRELEASERDILERIDERLERLDGWIDATSNPAMVELRAEVEMTRVSYEHQLAITRRLVEKSIRAADEREERAARRDALLERAFDDNSQALRALRDSLSGGNGR